MSNCHLILDCSMHSHVQRGNEEKVFGIDYSKGSLFDYVNESFAGPHDFFNHLYSYNGVGNNINYSVFANIFGEALSYTNVFVVSPIVLSSVVQPYDYLISINREI